MFITSDIRGTKYQSKWLFSVFTLSNLPDHLLHSHLHLQYVVRYVTITITSSSPPAWTWCGSCGSWTRCPSLLPLMIHYWAPDYSRGYQSLVQLSHPFRKIYNNNHYNTDQTLDALSPCAKRVACLRVKSRENLSFYENDLFITQHSKHLFGTRHLQNLTYLSGTGRTPPLGTRVARR